MNMPPRICGKSAGWHLRCRKCVRMSSKFHPTRYTRWNADASGNFEKPVKEGPRPTKGQSAIEYVLFGVFGVLLILAGIALYSMSSPKFKQVPNHFANGMKS